MDPYLHPHTLQPSNALPLPHSLPPLPFLSPSSSSPTFLSPPSPHSSYPSHPSYTHLPNSQKFGPLAWCSAGRVFEQALDMSDGAYSCSDYPGEPQEGVDTDEDTHNQQIKMIPRPFLKGKREGETEGGREGQEGREDAEEERTKRRGKRRERCEGKIINELRSFVLQAQSTTMTTKEETSLPSVCGPSG